MDLKNIFNTNGLDKSLETFQQLLSGKEFRLERIVSNGQATPRGEWYDQELDEWVILLSGSATIFFHDNSELINLRAGDYLHIPAHRKHRVESTDRKCESVWIAIHFLPE